jgi:branched-chain amino acid transport system permease protein
MVGAASRADADDGPGGIRRPRWHPFELVFWHAPLVAFLVMSDRRLFLSQVFIYGLLALSLDLILGYAGILSLGQAAFFGVGAYTAGLLARHGWPRRSRVSAPPPRRGRVRVRRSFMVVPGADLTRLMVTLGIGLLTAEAANQASSITGGVDGLSDMQPATLFGTFSFGLDGKTAFLYSFVVLALMFVVARRLVHSPFGLVLRGIRENARRMPAIGVDVGRRLRTVYALAAAMAGMAGALLAQTTGFVGIDTLGFQRSAELLIILAFGGTGRLYGALLGAAVFIVAQDVLAGISPAYWQFWLGAVLVVLVLVAPGRVDGRAGSVAATDRTKRRAKARAMASALRTEQLRRSFRGFVAVDDVSWRSSPARGTP